MMPENDIAATLKRKTEQRKWYKPVRCSVCMGFIWFHPTVLAEPAVESEPGRSWVLCKPCYKLFLAEINRSSIRSPARLRIALGLVAAERSPSAYNPERNAEREFAWAMWFLAFFGLLHLVLLALLLTIPR